jgi:endothelin-converting enzyme/putative endopeptidase
VTARGCAVLLAALACRTAAPPAPAATPAAPPAPGATAQPGLPAPAPPVAGIDASILDRSVSPCEDFYRFACGGWLERTAIPGDQATWSRSFSEIDERNRAQLRAIAEAAAAGKLGPGDRFADLVGTYFGACMDEPAIEARGLADLRAAWEELDAVKDARTIGLAVARLHARAIWPLFQLGSDQDARDATQVIGVVWQGGLSLPDRDYYLKDDGKTAEIRGAFQEHVARMFALAGVPEAEARRDAAAVLDLERRLAEAHWTRLELRDPERVYHRVELAGLERLAPRFPWRPYLDLLGRAGVTTFSTSTPRALERIDALLLDLPPAAWRAYLRWHVLTANAAQRTVPRAFVEERFRFLAASFTGQKELKPRWKHCVDMTDGALGEALGQAWVRRHFGAEGKERTVALVHAIEGAMASNLAALPWMDPPTRTRALEKLARVVNKIGYPDAWRDYSGLQLDRASFFRSAAAGSAFEVRRDLAKIGRPLDRTEWLMTPPEVNAYYHPSMNEMVFPAGILQPPFFAREAPDSVNHGAIGMVLGHELTHGFDDEGRRFDALGNLADWWTPSVAEEFDRRAACVARQFDGYDAVEGATDAKLDGKLTLGENIADLGGLKLALAAYQASRGAGPRGPEPGTAGFAPEQAFFVGYAQSWCTKVRPEAERLAARVDPHAPPRWRVNGPLANLPEFAAAFRCEPGSRMVREERCTVW